MVTISPFLHRVREYAQLTRPRIVLMVLFAMAVAAWCAGPVPPSWMALLHGLLGTALVTAGSVAMNQWYERGTDALMARTRHRPIPTGRIRPPQGLTFAVGISLLGIAYLFLFSTPAVLLVASLSWLFYAGCYTPLKSISVWQLPVGAVAGAMPMVIGGTLAGAPLSPMTVTLFAVVFCWQFPHAIAIAWIYRDHYARAGLQVASVKVPSGVLSGVLSVLGAVVLIPVSLLPMLFAEAKYGYGLVALASGIAYLLPSLQFLRSRTDAAARQMLVRSFFYLPLVLIALWMSG